MKEYLATVDLAAVAPGEYALGVDECRDEAIVDTIFSIPYPDKDSLRDADWDKILSQHGFERTSPWADQQGYYTADVRRLR
jgi:hypothetical protein